VATHKQEVESCVVSGQDSTRVYQEVGYFGSEWFFNRNLICPLLDFPTVLSSGQNQSAICSEGFLYRNPLGPLLDIPTVLSFGQNQVFRGRFSQVLGGIFKEEEKVSQGNGSKNYII
jgi:hypothetical protein